MKKYKSIRVFMGNTRLKDVYPYATKWQMFKFKFVKLVRKVLLWSLFIFLIAGTTYIFFPRYEQYEKQVLVDNLAGKIDEIKLETLGTLKKCESAGHSEDDGLIIFDSNNVASIGQFQFQVKTVIYYYKTLYNKVITPKEAVLIALDTAKAQQLADDIIFKADGLKNWTNCANKHQLRKNVEIYKLLIK